MRIQIAAANWKMNLTLQEASTLLEEIIQLPHDLKTNQLAVFAVPFPYIAMAQEKLANKTHAFIAAQNCSDKLNGAYTGETSVIMLQSMGIQYVVIGHSERREYFNENNTIIKTKVDLALAHNIHPIFCCGESLAIREAGKANEFVGQQLKESLFHLSPEAIQQVVIAYEPIWAIGTGKTATTEQAQEMHAFIRTQLTEIYGVSIAHNIPILYGGSVKAANAAELFASSDVDGGLVGGASLNAKEFNAIINSLK